MITNVDVSATIAQSRPWQFNKMDTIVLPPPNNNNRKCCQWLPADRYVSQRYSVWNVVSDFQKIIMFHSVTLYEMFSVTFSRSLCFTALQHFIQSNAVKHKDLLEVTDNISYRVTLWNIKICWKSLTTQWLPADRYVSQHYSVWNVVSDFQQIFMWISHRVLC
jgi:hypothetical protein